MDILNLSGGTVGFLKKVLDLQSQRHNLIASNIANADTPLYKSANISFEEQMSNVLNAGNGKTLTGTHKKHFSSAGSVQSIQPEVEVDKSSGRIDGNNVDMDKEMANLARNSLAYNGVAQILGVKFDKLKYAIDQGGK